MARLIISPRNRGVRQFNITGRVTTIGRAEANNVVIPAEQVSRHHAVVEWIDGGYVITDLGSRNGTYVNNERIRTRPLRAGDSITIGDCQVRFLWAAEATKEAEKLRLMTVPGDLLSLDVPVYGRAITPSLSPYERSMAERAQTFDDSLISLTPITRNGPRRIEREAELF